MNEMRSLWNDIVVKREAIKTLQTKKRFSSHFKQWKQECIVLLEEIPEKGSDFAEKFANVNYTNVGPLAAYASTEDWQQAWLNGLDSASAVLSSASLYLDRRCKREVNTNSKGDKMVQLKTRKVFVVHGHDNELKQTVARFLEKLQLDSIILHERPNEGRTIVEKFEHHSKDVCFAIVLLTPDDIGGVKGTEYSDLSARARQNVILELGYFMGLLGRKNVAVLKTGNVEIPSDYHGVVYIPAEDESWQWKVATEIKQAGVDIDLNTLV